MTSPVVTDAQSAVQLMMGIGCTLMGLSHILQPNMWKDYFATLHKQGFVGVLTRTMTWDLWSALLVVTLHQVWHGPGVVLTIFGWLLLAKCALSLLAPRMGLRLLRMSERGPMAFVWAGGLLTCVGFLSGAALLWG